MGNINIKDEYIIEDNGFTLTFFKNGLRHRKAGPALIWKKNEEKLPNLEEQKLYKVIFKELDSAGRNFLSSVEANSIQNIAYCLEGQSYSEKEFNSLLLNDELGKELTTPTKIDTKKPKV